MRAHCAGAKCGAFELRFTQRNGVANADHQRQPERITQQVVKDRCELDFAAQIAQPQYGVRYKTKQREQYKL